MTSLEFKRGGFYTKGDKTTNIFDDPNRAFHNLLGCIFSHTLQEELVDKAVNLLEYVKENDNICTTDFWRGGDQLPKTIKGKTYTFSNYQTIVRHLKNCGMLIGKKGGRLRLSRSKFCDYLEKASDVWRRWYRS